MKNFLLILALVASTFFATDASAQGFIKVNPLGLALGSLGASYEGVLNENSSFQVGAFFYARKFSGGGGARVQYRFYITSDDAPKGLFVAPLVGFGLWKTKFDNGLDDLSYSTLSLGGLIGYQWLFSEDKFSFEIGIGPAYRLRVGGSDDLDVGDLGFGIWPVGSLSLGYRIIE